MQVDGYSLDAQRDKLRKYAAYEDMIIAGEYSDEGFSGKNIQGRQDFQRMLNDIQDGKDDVSYVLVFKLSRFGRNAADVLNSLQLMQDFGVNLICVEDGIDSSKDAGKLMISVLSAVAEIERENIRTQTMAGREQKAREGKWNGGFAPYGYKLENGNLVIAEDEVEVIRVIYDRYIHTNEGVAGVAKYLVADGLFCREIDGLFCRSSPDIIVRRRCVLSHKRRGWLQPSPSFRYSRNLALQDELYHPVINNGPAVLVCVDKRLGTGPVNQSRDAG